MSADHLCLLCFFFNDTATTEIYTLSLHDALPISFVVPPLRYAEDAVRSMVAQVHTGMPINLLSAGQEIGRAHV